jgi:hypothetical protein
MNREGLWGLSGRLKALLKLEVIYSGLKARRAFCTGVRSILQAYVYFRGVYLRGLHLGYRRASYRHAGVHIMGVHLTGVHFTGMHFTGVHLTGVQAHILQVCSL